MLLKDEAKKEYDRDVIKSLKNINNKDRYFDPDNKSQYEVLVNNMKILLSQDGLCSIKMIKEKSKDVEKDYKLIREGMFDCLVWPAYAISINQIRSSKFKDRIDLLLLDIRKFYKVINNRSELKEDLIIEIMNKCDLGRAYIFPYTFYWLRSFGDFNNFLEKRNLKIFLYEEDGSEYEWTSERGFTDEYYKQLIKRIKKYRKINKKDR